MWIGIDDTDSASGGCTTHVLTEVVRDARAAGLDVVGWPRLVRLDPNVPWKTRGNAALAVRIAHGSGPPRTIGEIDGRPVRSYARGRELSDREQAELFERTCRTVDRLARRDRRTEPVVVGSTEPIDRAVYDRAVAEVLPRAVARAAVRSAHGRVWSRRDPRGLVGAAAALAWPARRRTFELIAYRSEDREAAERSVDPASVRRAVERFPGLFQCEDRRTRRLLIAPHTPCPILFGLRSSDPAELPKALRCIASEPWDRWLIFASNQGTGDHWVGRTIGDWPAYAAGRSRAVVRAPPTVLPGGHVRLEVSGEPLGRTRTCVAFEATKTLPRILAQLVPGDRLEIFGGRGRDAALRLERVQVLGLVPRWAPPRGPRCGACDRATESRGHGRGFRCPECRRRFPPESAPRVRVPPALRRGTYDPTPSARRHLHPRERRVP